ncbi:MAG TPA: SDR family oxidoreductase [Bryobacteraceae bacterium]|nr:SDR family oxidoreductase [Bryobacteraceae bacterium]
MQGKVVVITGGTSGIGQVSAEKLAAMGARIVLIARNKNRGEDTLGRLREIAPRQNHSVHYGDVSRLNDLNRLAAEIKAAEPRIDVLINNAGAVFGERQVTEDGLELTFATNHMSYFLLTHDLRDALLAAGAARVINTSSAAHYRAKIDFDDLQMQNNYSSFRAYGCSKLCNILFTRALVRRLEGTGITTNSLHPGFVKTRIGDGAAGFGAAIFRFMKNFAITPEKGAETIVYLASSNDVAKTTGLYFDKCKAIEPSKLAQDDAAAERLWQETAKLAGIKE